jgi:uncharacterized protein (DUF885 family)
MEGIALEVGFKGTLKEFFAYVRTDKRFRFEADEEGKAAYMAESQAVIDEMKLKLPGLFTVFPKADLRVKAVEPFREKSAGTAFYESPAVDGSRPGVFYVNLFDMSNVTKTELEALAYHEAIPGHHMQISIAQEAEGVPDFRKHNWFTAFGEGWALYSEEIPKELGFYQDPYSDFGRLSMELLRACRLVVDTGIHALKWSKERAVEYLNENTPGSETANVKSIERYIVMPGQATAYLIGKLKIKELRKRAKDQLGEGFDVRKFHDEVLRNGTLPLSVLEEQIDRWILDQSQVM